ncbi:hypothetical protein [Pseudofulvibacter geojedonensis]|uniref:Lipoprotein n=1 Tax=Pseudofulvibacter geojedonensis TaxID=1123758 RepID=A0ABW3HZ80_9FLAO
MLRKVVLIAVATLFVACDDGDVFVTNLEFDDVNLQHCSGNTDFILYKIKTQAPYESLSARLPISSANFLTTAGENTTSLSSTHTFNYRTYNGDPTGIFCNSLPPTNPNTTSDSFSDNGTVKFITSLTIDDNDGIPAEFEDLNNNGNFDDDDTDGDGIPNYLDSDDDGDNVPTINEMADPDGDGDLSDAVDTDGDGTPNYLDEDDDEDGILTRNEDSNGNVNPQDDITQPAVGPDYLNSAIQSSTINNVYLNHTRTLDYSSTIHILNLFLVNSSTNETIINEDYNFGTITTPTTTETYEVPFN